MSTAAWWSQPVAAEGSTASEGIRRQLGKPHLDALTVLIRETAQNTCDAALPGASEVQFAVRLNQLSGHRLQAWADYLLPEPPGSNLGVQEAIERGPLILTVADRGTTGLGGPLRADEIPEPGERSDFVNFMRNVGEPKDLDLGGGSYGFGKGILYNVSRCHVVVADSVCVYRGRRQRRLIGAALGDGYRYSGKLYTGRHWLGPLDTDNFARPLLDDEAEEMSLSLGLPRFDDDATGTTVAVVDADLGRRITPHGDATRDADEAAEFIVSTMLWHLWPRLLSGRSNRLICSMRRDGFVTEVPDPESLVELKPFSDAYRAVLDGGDYEVPIRRQAPQEVGRFAIARTMAPVRPHRLVSLAAPWEGRAHHCARMRQADLIVSYVEGDVPADEAIQYGAVFRASADADQYFAEAEPPTHDDWVLDGLRGTARGVVQLAGSFVRDQLRGETQSPADQSASGDTPLGFLASRLAGLMSGAEGDAATASTPGDRPRPSRSANATPRIVAGPSLVDEDGSPMIHAIVQFPAWPSTRVVLVEPLIVLDGGVEAPDPSAEDAPVVLGWTSVASGVIVDGPELVVDRHAERRWLVRVKPARDAVTRLKVSTAEDDA